MNSEKRLLIALAIMFIILGVYPWLMKKINPPQKPEPTKVEEPVTVKTTEPVKREDSSPPSSPAAVKKRDIKTDEIVQYSYENEVYDISFTNLGASINRIKLKDFEEASVEKTFLVDSSLWTPGALSIQLKNESETLEDALFERKETGSRNVVEYIYSGLKGLEVTKRFLFIPEENHFVLEVIFRNTGGSRRQIEYEIASELFFGKPSGYDAGFVGSNIKNLENKIKWFKLKKLEKNKYPTEGAEWMSLDKRYFTFLLDPAPETNALRFKKLGDERLAGYLKIEPFSLSRNEKVVHRFEVFAGPKRYTELKALGYQGILTTGFFGIFKVGLLVCLQFFYQLSHNYGVAIILLTILIKIIFTPLTHMSFESMRKMQALQPKMKALQEMYKDDPQRMNKEVMQLYKKNKVNPLSGCLPMLLQMPIFIALYQTLSQAVELHGAKFVWWINDLSQPDKLFTLPFSIPFLGDGVNLLPILMIGSMVWQQKLTPQAASSKDQQRMMKFMPILFGFIFYRLPSGLVLYWFVNNILTILHQAIIKKKGFVPHEDHT